MMLREINMDEVLPSIACESWTSNGRDFASEMWLLMAQEGLHTEFCYRPISAHLFETSWPWTYRLLESLPWQCKLAQEMECSPAKHGQSGENYFDTFLRGFSAFPIAFQCYS
jgi:hypothetical protein